MTTRPRKAPAKKAPRKPPPPYEPMEPLVKVRRYVLDLAERVASTFAEAFAGVFTVTAVASALDAKGLVDWAILEKLAASGVTAGVVALGALIKGLAARRVGAGDTASLVAVPPNR